MKHRSRRLSNIALPFLCFVVGYPTFEQALLAQNQELQQRVAEIKQAGAHNKQALMQFTWVEQVTVILNGEQKKQEHFQVRLGPDGKPQKTSLDPPESSDSGGREGRLKRRIVEKKNQRSACWFRKLTASLRTSDENRWREKTQTTGPQCPATERMARQVRTDLARSSGLRSKKDSGLGRDFFLDFFLYRTSSFIELTGT